MTAITSPAPKALRQFQPGASPQDAITPGKSAEGANQIRTLLKVK